MVSDPPLTVDAGAPGDAGDRRVLRWENNQAARYYEVRLVRDLFGDWNLMRVWGGIGSGLGRLRFEPLAEPAAFADELVRIAKRRVQRGYVQRPVQRP